MQYSIEDIYKFSGQYDEVACVSFHPNSESKKKFGVYVIGKFIYTPAERIELQEAISNEYYIKTDGFVKFFILQSNLSSDIKNALRKTGFKTSDISIIEQFRGHLINQFVATDIRSLPKPIEIKVDTKNTDNDALSIYLYDQMIKTGFRLAPFEVEIYHAALLNKFGDKFSREEYNNVFLDENTGLIKSGIRYFQLSNKRKSKIGLNDAEQIEFDAIMEQRATERLKTVDKELEKAFEKPNEAWIKYAQLINIVASFITYFETFKPILTKSPIWLDFDRFVHIYFRHTKIAQIGERYQEKSLFQYSFKDTRRLIETILGLVRNDIEEHFTKNKGKDFKRHGSMAVYYNGDYYRIDIASNGRIMNLHKQGIVR